MALPKRGEDLFFYGKRSILRSQIQSVSFGLFYIFIFETKGTPLVA